MDATRGSQVVRLSPCHCASAFGCGDSLRIPSSSSRATLVEHMHCIVTEPPFAISSSSFSIGGKIPTLCKRRTVTLFRYGLVALFTFGLSGCGGSNSSSTNPTQAPAVTSANSANFTEDTASSFIVTATGTPTPSIAESGTLPSGVTFSAGTLSGTPTAIGTFPITFTAQNGITPNATQNFTLTVSPAPLTITTTTLPNGTVGTVYSTTLNATGGVPPYTWDTTGLPAGLSLSSSGVISGVPITTGTSTHTVSVSDSENVRAHAGRSITITAATACTKNANLAGGYALMIHGWTGPLGKLFEGGIGSFQADGNGNITQGMMDVNAGGLSPGPGPSHETFTGTYCLASNNLGTVTMNPSSGSPRILAFSLQSDGNGSIIFFDTSTSFQGSGVLRKQQTAPFSTSEITGSYAFGFVGVDGSTGQYRQSMAGEFTTDGSGNVISGSFSSVDNSGSALSAANVAPITGTYSVASTGRGTMTLLAGYMSPSSFVFYVVSATEVLMLDYDVAGAVWYVGVVAGQGLLQTGPFTSVARSRWHNGG